ncbi:phosphoadenylyl-sulfate reductase [Rhodovibrio sodomensis]|uniref:phosphoadenylyl-sulfate reductase n=1 Tax=Rhodovibrio sodomensis TaxID=1088 RepID=UPI001F5B5652|nr:phosphoadenylyl-sulfate reductase [Rhodovibrio sodomensis]
MDGSTPITPADRMDALDRAAAGLSGEELLELAIRQQFPGSITAVSSFGAEAALLLDMIARIDPATPVIFLETGKHFPETLRYRDRLIAKLGLTGVRNERPDAADQQRTDPDGHLWSRNPDRCCALRKVRPLERALQGFDAWITGRKRFQTATREGLPRLELADGRVKVNPLADWTQADVDAAFDARGLPRHPLVDQGYPSIGCLPCTRRVGDGEDARAGRWAGMEKTECGIHNAWWAQQGSGSGI